MNGFGSVLVCKYKNKTSQKNTRKPGLNSFDVTNKKNIYNIRYLNMQYHRKIITSAKSII